MKISRRTFLFGALATAVSTVLARAGLDPESVMAATLSRGRRFMEGQPLAPKVIVIHSPKATSWDFSTYPYVDYVDKGQVRLMLNRAIQALTGEKTYKRAWGSVFAAYHPGDKIAIKPNLNDLHEGFHGYVTSPAVINAVINGLVEFVGARPADITVYEMCRVITDEMRSRIDHPVNYIESKGDAFIRKLRYKAFGGPSPAEADLDAEIKMSNKVTDWEGRPIKCYIPGVVTSSRHIINIPILKSHQFVAISGALKNHYGTVRFSDGSQSPTYLHPPIIDDSIADINAHEEIRSKTRLVVMDALFGRTHQHGGSPERWSTLGGKSPNRLFVSKDPVAIDSLSRSFLKREMESRGQTILSDQYLRNAHKRGLGIYENPGKKGTFKKIRVGELEV